MFESCLCHFLFLFHEAFTRLRIGLGLWLVLLGLGIASLAGPHCSLDGTVATAFEDSVIRLFSVPNLSLNLTLTDQRMVNIAYSATNCKPTFVGFRSGSSYDTRNSRQQCCPWKWSEVSGSPAFYDYVKTVILFCWVKLLVFFHTCKCSSLSGTDVLLHCWLFFGMIDYFSGASGKMCGSADVETGKMHMSVRG